MELGTEKLSSIATVTRLPPTWQLVRGGWPIRDHPNRTKKSRPPYPYIYQSLDAESLWEGNVTLIFCGG